MHKPAQEIHFSLEADVATLTIHRANKRNALTEAMWGRIEHCLDETVSSGVKVLRLEGMSGVFSTGSDLDEMAKLLASPERCAMHSAQVQRAQLALRRLPIATLAVIDGDCIEDGLGLALACDLRIASRRSHFALAPARLGLAYSVEDSARLIGVVGTSRATDMLFTGRNLDAYEAAAWGLVNRVVEVEMLPAAAAAMEKSLRTASPTALAAIKLALAHLGGDPGTGRDVADGAFAACFSGRDFAEGASAFLEKRAPQFGEVD